jgi:hypothetical protein
MFIISKTFQLSLLFLSMARRQGDNTYSKALAVQMMNLKYVARLHHSHQILLICQDTFVIDGDKLDNDYDQYSDKVMVFYNFSLLN